MENWDVIIIGAGSAGLAAGIYAVRSGLKTLILDEKLPGGTISDASIVVNYPGFAEISGGELAEKMTLHCRKVGAIIHELEPVTGLELKEEKKIQELSLLADAGNSLASAQLQVKKTLKKVTRPQSPHNIIEHVKIVNNDIQKVFGNPNRKNENKNIVIPKEFRLSQNYPNPFNPTTKIQYDLPKDVKVKLIIYDILGREVIRLVNNEFKQAGRYTVEFNGNNYASGVYFYRIEAAEFVQSKKMVLVK